MAIKIKSGDGWATVPGTAGTFATPTQYHERVVLTEAATVIPIGLALRPGDLLTVLQENLPLVEGQNYTRGDGSITLAVAAKAGATMDFFAMHYDIAPTRGHVDDRENPHRVTAAQLGDGTLTEGSLLKLKGGKLTKAVEGVDYVSVTQLSTKGDSKSVLLKATSKFLGVDVRVARVGDIVSVTANYIERFVKETGDYLTVCTLPEGFRPSHTVDIIQSLGPSQTSNIMVMTNGQVEFGLFGEIGSTESLRINFSFTV